MAAFAIVLAGASALPAAASAADEIGWGFRHQFRSYIATGNGTPPITASSGATCDPNPNVGVGGCDPKMGQPTPPAFKWTAANSNYSLPSGDGTIEGDGTVVFSRPNHFFILTLEDPTFTITNGTDVSVEARVIVESTFPDVDPSDGRYEVGNFTLTGPPLVTATTVTWTTGSGTSTQGFADATGNLLAPGSELDPITITLPLPPAPTGTPVASANITVKDNAAKPKAKLLKLTAKDAGVVLGDYDPTVDGATVQATSTTFDNSYPLPASGWKKTIVKKTGAVKQYKYSDPKQLNGPVKTAILKNGQLTFVANGAGLGHSLASEPGDLRVAFSSDDSGICAGPTGKVNYKAGKTYVATKNTAPADCPALPNTPDAQ